MILGVAAMAASFDVRMAHHEEPQLSSHLLCSIPHGTYIECFHPDRDPIWDGMYANRSPVKDGEIAVPAGPGFDIQLDWDMVKKYRID